ncbi:4Fe-4S binding domain-containing protein [Selenomonas ruminantium]|uniref:4Fe-4S binding domain-containing protein n=1 Tax=Selenomonas ruminantium TaxID=971 RepID=A0A1M6TUR6_SELRU|nr:4Fe-4S binding protein [Selenomonas ruminantium]SHK60630.1 4Fe-4S binding domain-containing protein [Selenomonas ruminantium]
MPKRNIDLNRCLFHYTNVSCNRCQAICPQSAIQNRDIDAEKCDNCGLCTAVCPTGAIQSDADYDAVLTVTQNFTPQVLMCRKVSPAGMPCLGALNRRLLWALAEKQPLAIDTSRCAACNPAVFQWLETEIAACNDALQAAGKAPLKLVHVKDAAPAAKPVARRSFFRSLFHAAADTATEIAAAQTQQQYAFDPVIWLEKQGASPCSLFPGLTMQASCTACGLCTMLCPEKALTIRDGRELAFNPVRCTACGLCHNNCPQSSLKLLPSFNGQTAFPLRTDAPSPPTVQDGSTLQRG